MKIKSYTKEELLLKDSNTLLGILDQLRHLAAETGAEWAVKHKVYQDYKEMLPSILASIQIGILDDGSKYNESKVRALATEEYKEKVLQMNKAEFEALKLKTVYQSLNESLKALTSISYVKNTELKVLRG